MSSRQQSDDARNDVQDDARDDVLLYHARLLRVLEDVNLSLPGTDDRPRTPEALRHAALAAARSQSPGDDATARQLARDALDMLATGEPTAPFLRLTPGELRAGSGGSGSSAGTTTPDTVGHVGLAVGPYTLVRLIGEGGMGEVWEARQQHPIRRRVAVKLLRLTRREGAAGPGGGILSDRRHAMLRRFEAERQALANLQHADVARIYDAGVVDTGRDADVPWFAMEFVAGMPVTRFAREAKPGLRDRLRLVARLADAVEHAHRRGLIHRDLKPANILAATDAECVDGVCLKIIDFGISKIVQSVAGEKSDVSAAEDAVPAGASWELTSSPALLTRAGSTFGTPAYMSPEQSRDASDVDTRADVWSLGVIMYELLTGSLPSPRPEPKAGGRTWPTDPSAKARVGGGGTGAGWADALRGALGRIPVKAMQVDPELRYASAADFARDIRAYLDGRPLSVGPRVGLKGVHYRLRLWTTRNKGYAASAAVVAVLLGLAGSARRLAGGAGDAGRTGRTRPPRRGRRRAAGTCRRAAGSGRRPT